VTPVRAYIALGSNLGARERHLALGRTELAALPGTTWCAASSIEETEPLAGLVQPRYLNQMVALDTELTPRQLLAACQRIERLAGRERRLRWESRTLDLDIVRYGTVELADADLELPHPGLGEREFWQRELAELARVGC